jgi:hypothetical protein
LRVAAVQVMVRPVAAQAVVVALVATGQQVGLLLPQAPQSQ